MKGSGMAQGRSGRAARPSARDIGLVLSTARRTPHAVAAVVCVPPGAAHRDERECDREAGHPEAPGGSHWVLPLSRHVEACAGLFNHTSA